jgi:hypothetical protein
MTIYNCFGIQALVRVTDYASELLTLILVYINHN